MEELRVICYYHSRDLDGWMSAAIVHKKYPEAELVGWDYGDPEPVFPKKESLLIIVDIAFNPMTMMNLTDTIHDIVWIDHHISAIKASRKGGYKNLPGKRNVDYAACELTWKHFFRGHMVPHAVELLGAYDCFRHKKKDLIYQDRVMWFQYAARTFITGPEDAYIKILNRNNSALEEWLSIGRNIFRYLEMEAQGIYDKAFRVILDDHMGLLVCRERFNPANFGIDYHKDGYRFFGCFWFDGVKWTVSLYNDDGNLDVSEICKKRGGGGHAGASGYTTKDIDSIIYHPGP